MVRTTEGIVIRSLPYGEADLLVTYFTLDFGLMKAFAKSPRKTKSRFGSSLEPLTCARISVMGREGAGLPRLTQSDIIRPFHGLREDINRFLLLTEMSELIMSFMPEGEVNSGVYLLMKQVMGMMEKEFKRELSLLFKLRFLSIKGYQPRLSGCARCGGQGGRFYQSHGSVICPACASQAPPARASEEVIDVSSGLVKLCDALGTWEMARAPRIRASKKMIEEAAHVLESHIEHLLSRRLRTAEFMDSMDSMQAPPPGLTSRR